MHSFGGFVCCCCAAGAPILAPCPPQALRGSVHSRYCARWFSLMRARGPLPQLLLPRLCLSDGYEPQGDKQRQTKGYRGRASTAMFEKVVYTRAQVCKVATRQQILGLLLLIMRGAHEAEGANCAAGANQTGCLVSDGARVCVTPGLQACKAPTTEGSVTTVAGSSQGSMNGIGASAQFSAPNSVAISADGTFALVADCGNHRIRRIVLASQAVTTLAGSSYGYANGIGAAAQFRRSNGVAISADGTFALVADRWNHRIRRIVLASQAVTTLAGSSQGSANGIGAAPQFS
eukprot:COSAG01_NODE_20679_length_940_cov_2.700357_1_plen_289_part_10